MRNYINLAAAILVSLFSLTGCSRSSDTSSTQKTGYFIDTQVQGLNYEASSGEKGKTNSLG